uniref:SNRNP25 ubiquitin-like domain-containing protein n=1 Tax=Stomoxys calcitrans TaxID=35570 RepID=A0A1I8PA86_STOCA
MSTKSAFRLNRRKRRLPLNLARQYERERRIQNGGIGVNRKSNRRKVNRRSKDFEVSELDALIYASEMQLKEILENEELLSDIPVGYTPEELEGEISLAQGGGTTIYVERDGLSTLTIVLPQDQPTIAQLKRAIAVVSRAQLRRELRERQEERMRRRQNVLQQSPTIVKGLEAMSNTKTEEKSSSSKQNFSNKAPCMSSNMEPIKTVHLTGELVCSATHNGHQHRPSVSWRYLWRAYALFNTATKSMVDDENGRKLLSECGIENAQTLRFTKREKYQGKKRQ